MHALRARPGRAILVAIAGGFVVAAQAQTGSELRAVIPVEVLPVDPALATGALWLSGPRWSEPRIALQPARAAAAVAVDESENEARLYVLTLLGAIERKTDGAPQLDVGADRRAWCELPRLGRPFAECFQDTDGDSAFDAVRQGALGNTEPLSLNRVGEPKAIEPRGYRAARPDEIPQFQVGYESCRSRIGDALPDNAELRYSSVIRRVGQRQLMTPPTPTHCNNLGELLETRDDGNSVVQFGRFKVLLHREGDEIVTSLLEGIAPGTYLGGLRGDQPLTDAADISGRVAAQSPLRPFLYFVALPTFEAGDARAGEPIVIGEVAHGITGTLTVEAKTGGWSKSITIPAGTALYGAAMSSSGQPGSFDPTVVWCAPQPDGRSQCFAGGMLTTNFLPYVVQYLSVGSGSRGVAAPIVERGPVDFGAPLVLTLRFDGIDRRNVRVSWSVARAETPAWSEIRLRRNGQGQALLAVAGALIEVTPSQDGGSANLRRLGEFQEGADAIPLDAGGLVR